MEVFWCSNCEVPVLQTMNKDKKRAEENPYLDIEDEVIEWVLDNAGNEADYFKFIQLKKEVDKRIENKKEKTEIKKEIIEEPTVDLKMGNRDKLLEFTFRYLELKLADQEDNNNQKQFCPNCNNEINYVSKDIRPVFMKERIMLSILLDRDVTESNIWNGVGNRYIIDGETSDIVIKDLYNADNLDQKIEKIQQKVEENDREVDFSKFIEVNREHFNYIDKNAIDFIEKTSEIFNKRLEVVSFSGGKDSTVVSDLVRRAFSSQDVLHVFGDTTLEFPFTYDYIERIKNKPNRPPFLPVDTPNQSFYDLAEQFGPPSRVISWCCSIFKTGPIGNLFREVANQQEILTFYGVRRSESTSRSKYDKITQSPKISKQLVVSPIIDWHDSEVWLYLLTRGIDFNEAYKLGFTRVGCWCCPNNSAWSEFLCKIFMPKRAESWRDFLVDFAKKVGKPDPEVYVDTGKWKARQGGQGLDTSNTVLEAEPCALENKAKNYDLTRPIDDSLYEFFKPFGVINKDIGDQMLGEVYILEAGIPKIKLQGNKGSNQLKIIVFEENLKQIKEQRTKDKKLSSHLLFQRIECQIRKYQSCISCSACLNVCSNDAISLTRGYKVDEEKCDHCMDCVAHFHKGCLITKAMVDY
ncbi:PAPS reductase/FAD synthetase family protein [Halobacteroides halobius DSM 5150]|uniref:PAPS reductase/FAD synthetase family protein n=1 Tax=Halobacteroides halobius (strain ATCC 35273 / DSM 5150 / MD-1) TaxID=748449 RepID=L0KBW1_HALHC|nr:phosphoadenosine phosphosulfate reductase family protein [Halobacteroides halobius]AGB42040.1 PAPS reductase/FAD synthetase family protein [Halobacteroides halobius DSM 5150]